MKHAWERFQFVKRLGRGGFGETLLVRDQNEGGRSVVIKVPHDDDTERALIQELINNAVLHASLREMYHPHIVKYLGFDKYESRYVMVMDYVKGTDIRKIIGPFHRPRPPMDLNRAVRLMRHVCAGLVAAHNARLQHNDIKPENILVEEEGDLAKLTDFGVSRIRQSTSSSGTVAGTFPYMAPEMWHGRGCFQSDLWSVGVTFYEMVTGRLPFYSENVGDLKQKIDRDDPAPPAELNPHVDRRLQQLIIKALEKNPRQRFQTAQEMLSALETDVDQQILQARELFREGKAKEAETLLQKLLDFHPGEARLYLTLGDFYNRCFQWGEGEKVLRRGVANCPQHARMHFSLALVLANLNKRREAVPVLERALQLGLGAEQQAQAERLLEGWRARSE
jgi:serine/threonine-protein kinase